MVVDIVNFDETMVAVLERRGTPERIFVSVKVFYRLAQAEQTLHSVAGTSQLASVSIASVSVS
jgi:DNA gyrase inhibitor GyrI